jgi:hypothetical protein
MLKTLRLYARPFSSTKSNRKVLGSPSGFAQGSVTAVGGNRLMWALRAVASCAHSGTDRISLLPLGRAETGFVPTSRTWRLTWIQPPLKSMSSTAHPKTSPWRRPHPKASLPPAWKRSGSPAMTARTRSRDQGAIFFLVAVGSLTDFDLHGFFGSSPESLRGGHDADVPVPLLGCRDQSADVGGDPGRADDDLEERLVVLVTHAALPVGCRHRARADWAGSQPT